jgi:3-oxoacyl-(acyl-carrier-protein) synthase III
MAVGVLAVGSHVPEQVIDNDEISAWTGAPAGWVAERTGIHHRRYAAAGAVTSDLARDAAARVLAQRPEARDQISALIVATCTPDVPQPATAAVLQHKLGLRSIPAFDVNAVCCGFLYGLRIADGLLAGAAPGDQVLVVGADMFSTIMNRDDRRTVSLFGDGAGAVLVGRVPDGYGLLATRLITDGEFHHYVGVEAGGTRTPLDDRARSAGDHLLRMDGRSIKDYAIATLGKLVGGILEDVGLNIADIDRFVLHQANVRLLEAFAADNGIDPAKVVLTAPDLGNTAVASIPITLDAAGAQRPFQRGEHVLMAAIGGGMTAAATLLRWY